MAARYGELKKDASDCAPPLIGGPSYVFGIFAVCKARINLWNSVELASTDVRFLRTRIP